MIDLEPSDEQDQIVQAVADFLSGELPVERLRSATNAEPSCDQIKWPELGTLGYFGMGLDEELGGVGYGLVEEVLVFREFGRFLISPVVLGSVLGARIAARAGQNALAEEILSGKRHVGLAIPFEYGGGAPPLTGDFHLVDSQNSDWIVTWTNAGAALISKEHFSATETVQCIDWTISLQRIRFTDLQPNFWIGTEIDDVPGRANLLAAAMLAGIAQGAVTDSVEYVKMREQFGQPIGAFQAVKHRCADMATRAGAAWSQTLFAALINHQGDADAPFQRTAAKIVATEAALRNAAADIQNFGGMGFTSEQSPHLFLKRAHILDRVSGDLAWQRNQLLAMPAPL